MDIGKNIRRFRELKGLSLTQLSNLTGFSISFLSQIERSVANPSINSLKKISDALDTQLASLFTENDSNSNGEKDFIVRANERKKLYNPGSKAEMYLLSPSLDNEIELIMIVAQPGGKSGDEYYSHHGEEIGIVIQGSLQVDLDGQIYTLKQGDSMQFNSNTPHKWMNTGSHISR
ncbi:cupin domain-containing protein [Peribacillus cavernae]|uniref:Cupin domain-containing protein n=1 Tax=Peribacillus cavernae TaxID=1674310 RepID=A0A433H6M9_9BACI|nr:cupin domain-containing protein [Peribacillus cavernae]MDQ0221382.1 transcriptional regulator with XRE-family HTH domain [Peribacillus cavernae]RUQ23976.1 cupin domain-containing protein [Peribacillus cavernae]